MAQSSVPVPAFSASAVEQVCRILADVVTGPEIPNLIAPLLVTEEPGDEKGTKWKRLFNAVAARQDKMKDGRPLIRLVLEVMAPVRFPSQAEFDAARTRLNERLLLSGFEVRADGKVVRTQQAVTLGEAQLRADDLRAELARRNCILTCWRSAVPSWCSRTTSTQSWRLPRAWQTSCGTWQA